MAKQQEQTAVAGIATGSDFTQLLNQEFRPKTEQAREAVELAVQTLAEQALRQSATISDDAYKSIAAIIAQIDHKLSEQIKHHQRQRRDVRRTAGVGSDEALAPARAETPSQVVAHRELLEKFREQLTEEERKLADLRAAGLDWAQVASQLGGTAEGRRKQLARAVERIGAGLGLDTANA